METKIIAAHANYHELEMRNEILNSLIKQILLAIQSLTFQKVFMSILLSPSIALRRFLACSSRSVLVAEDFAKLKPFAVKLPGRQIER